MAKKKRWGFRISKLERLWAKCPPEHQTRSMFQLLGEACEIPPAVSSERFSALIAMLPAHVRAKHEAA